MVNPFPEQASYAVALAYRIRFAMQFNAREAFHMLELRSSPQGHPAYRTVAQEMHRLIAEAASSWRRSSAPSRCTRTSSSSSGRFEAG